MNVDHGLEANDDEREDFIIQAFAGISLMNVNFFDEDDDSPRPPQEEAKEEAKVPSPKKQVRGNELDEYDPSDGSDSDKKEADAEEPTVDLPQASAESTVPDVTKSTKISPKKKVAGFKRSSQDAFEEPDEQHAPKDKKRKKWMYLFKLMNQENQTTLSPFLIFAQT